MGTVVSVDDIHHREVCVLLSGAQRRVPQTRRDRYYVGAVLQHVGCKAVSQSMRSHLDLNAGELQPDGEGFQRGPSGVLRTDPIIDPILCLLNETVSSLGFCYKSIDCTSHNESPKPFGFGVFNSSSCPPVKSDGTSLYCESDSVPAILVRFCHSSPTLSQGQREKQTYPLDVCWRGPSSIDEY